MTCPACFEYPTDAICISSSWRCDAQQYAQSDFDTALGRQLFSRIALDSGYGMNQTTFWTWYLS